jgi:hypothetical protein
MTRSIPATRVGTERPLVAHRDGKLIHACIRCGVEREVRKEASPPPLCGDCRAVDFNFARRS